MCCAGTHIGKVLIDVSRSPKVPSANNCLCPKGSDRAVVSHIKEGTLALLSLQPVLHFRYDSA